MAIKNSLSTAMMGFGSGRSDGALTRSFTLNGTALQTNMLPVSGLLSPAVSRGKVRVKLSPTSGTISAVSVTVLLGDGTNYVQILQFVAGTMAITPGTVSAPNGLDITQDFVVDISANRIAVNTTIGGTSPVLTMDVEVSGSS